MSIELIGFIVLSAGLLATASMVVIARNPIHCALALIASFFFLAGLYLTLNANFVAIIQVLVYAGAIMVLFLFVIMLLNLSDDELGESRWNLHKVIGSIGAFFLAGVLIWAVVGAQDAYLDEPASARSASIHRLRTAANEHVFPNQEARNTFYLRLTRLHVLAAEKVRLDRGGPEAKEDACQTVANFASEIDAAACGATDMQIKARGFAAAQLGDFDRQLAELEAQIDRSPVPADWRGEAATGGPQLEPSRPERAALLVVEIAFGIRLDSLVDSAAARLITADQRAMLDAIGRSDAEASQADADPKGARDVALRTPGGRFALSVARAEHLVVLADVEGSAAAELDAFNEAAAKLRKEYAAVAGQVLSEMRDGRSDRVLQQLIAVRRSVGPGMTALERSTMAEVIGDLSTRGPRFAGLGIAPAIYDKDDFGSVEAVGRQLFTRFLLPFEVTSVLLLVGILGAVVIAKRKM